MFFVKRHGLKGATKSPYFTKKPKGNMQFKDRASIPPSVLGNTANHR